MLSESDLALLATARDIIQTRQKQDKHHIGCALRTNSGRIFAAVHLETYVGRAAVCAEAIAIGMGAAEGDTDIQTIVAVNRQGNVVSPCGICRELIFDYAPNATVILAQGDQKALHPIADLLPNKYFRSGVEEPEENRNYLPGV